MVQLVEEFERQIFNEASDIFGTPELVQAAELFRKEVDRVNAKTYRNVWSIPKENQPV